MIIGRAIHLSFERRHADENDVVRVRNIRHVPFHGKNWYEVQSSEQRFAFPSGHLRQHMPAVI